MASSNKPIFLILLFFVRQSDEFKEGSLSRMEWFDKVKTRTASGIVGRKRILLRFSRSFRALMPLPYAFH